jgi:hypothetical protein
VNTLWRAFEKLLKPGKIQRALDVLNEADKQINRDLATKPLSIDSTCYEDHHRSDHYRRVCDKWRQKKKKKKRKSPGSWGKSVNRARRRKVRRMPKLTLAVAAASHRILAMKAVLGNGSDIPDLLPMLTAASRCGKVKTAVADAGYDSEDNHRIARQDMGVRSIIPPGIGRPTSKLPTGRWRRLMAKRMARKADRKVYGQRAQSETAHSMMKRNQSSALRARKPENQKKEMMLRALTHNIMLLCDELEG